MERTIVRLKIISPTMSPAAISAYVGVDCDRSWKIGDFRNKTTIKEKENGWIISSGLPESAPLDSHVSSLLDRVRPYEERIRALGAANTVEFSCVLYSKQTPAINFNPDEISRIARLGASLDVDHYCM